MNASNNGPRALPAGSAGTFEFALRFDKWARGLTVPLTWGLIAAEWGVSRATAYRYLNAYNAARGAYDMKEAA